MRRATHVSKRTHTKPIYMLKSAYIWTIDMYASGLANEMLQVGPAMQRDMQYWPYFNARLA